MVAKHYGEAGNGHFCGIAGTAAAAADCIPDPFWAAASHHTQGQSMNLRISTGPTLIPGLFMRKFLRKCSPFFKLIPRFDKCHETSQIFTRTYQTFGSAMSPGVIFKLRLGGKM